MIQVSPLEGPSGFPPLSSNTLAPGHGHCDQLALGFPMESIGSLAYSKVSIQRREASAVLVNWSHISELRRS